jgi:hypothetical protein
MAFRARCTPLGRGPHAVALVPTVDETAWLTRERVIAGQRISREPVIAGARKTLSDRLALFGDR